MVQAKNPCYQYHIRKISFEGWDALFLALNAVMSGLKHLHDVVHRLIAISREREYFLEIFKIQVDNIILRWVADRVPIYW